MTNILQENQNQIRTPLNVFCGLTSRENVELMYSVQGNKLLDSLTATPDWRDALLTPTWDMDYLADFQGEGFILDGTAELVEENHVPGLEAGKYGARSNVGQPMIIEAWVESGTINALTVAVTSGNGTIEANGVTYEARRIVVIPVNGQRVTMTFTPSDADERIEVASITAGISLSFTNENLISCELDLRSDLSIVNPSWSISSITIQAYWPDDISTVVSNIGDDIPVYYYSGYEGDYSTTRNFYISEAVTQKENLLTIRAEDQSHKLEDAKNVALQRLDTTANSGYKSLYNWFTGIIKTAGIKPTYTQSAPAISGSSTASYCCVMQEASPREYVADIMNQAHVGTFWPTYVDAGIPRVTWTKPTKKWDIYEEDCGDVERRVERQVAKLKVPNGHEYGLNNTANKATGWTAILKDIKIKANTSYIRNFQDWYWTYKLANVRNNKLTWNRLNSVAWVANATTYSKKVKQKVNGKTKTVTKWYNRPTLYGKKLTISKGQESVVFDRQGYTAEMTQLALGKVYQGTTIVYPLASRLAQYSNEGGSFTWKGNPKMQPRDVFTFHRLDGTTETCTIETIELKHDKGGTTAEISYRKGIV